MQAQLDDSTPGKISVWIGTTSKGFDEFNAYYEGLEDPQSGCGIHRDLCCTFIDTDMFVTYGTADFAHPLAGLQLVKGSIEPGESASAAALRELAEEAGIAGAHVERDLG